MSTNVSSARHGGEAHVNGLYRYGKDELLVAGCAWPGPGNSHFKLANAGGTLRAQLEPAISKME